MGSYTEGDLRIKSSVLGAVGTNCYFVYNETTKKAVIIDPADNATYIVNQCVTLGITPEAILLTHGHADHMLATEEIRKQYGIPVIAGEKEERLLADPTLNLSPMIGGRQVGLRADRTVRDREELELIGFRFQVIETPGHTEGSVCYRMKEEGVLFAGDTLFEESFGRTDFPTGSISSLAESIIKKLFTLPDDTMVYSGHGPATGIGHEKEYNPIYQYAR
ncbi:MBL fold metallo-hydrolase [Clostridium sp. AM58-1XD]|uniref:MBL fold metallo-hydrolase n=1 Tax=Clostridium sp. AM58-1XD TaxID=2292307 RepID=UPI000E4DE8CC|nr:MBL fold metallo-hydrolase [Clostridium sp. AM58-1XD]RGY99047.1 MBL fold metallo-hydrolase [Clostridium sp. AM58-1XD]